MKLFLLFIFVITFSSAYTQYSWSEKANFPSSARQSPMGFSIGDKGYVVGGQNNGNYYNDCWEYDPSTDSWTQKASYNGTGRIWGVGFSIGTKGYIGLGQFGTDQNDFWEFDADANTWTQKASYPDAGSTTGSIAFSVGDKGYVGLGVGYASTNNLWEYDPATDQWTQKSSFPGGTRQGAAAFSIGTKGYVGTGYGGGYQKDLWEYDPATDTWTRKADMGGQGRYYAPAFSINGQGYITSGANDYYQNDTWEYDPATDSWTQIAYFNFVFQAAAFSIGNSAYVALGVNNNQLSSQLWRLGPCAEGDPSVFGDNVWNVYAWNAGGASDTGHSWNTNYSGYYVDTALSFDTRNKWNASLSPSNAPGYQGCPVMYDNHSWSAKRKGFPCGHYAISIPGHDDEAQLLVNGVKVWEHNGCCDSHDSVWVGNLGPDSTVEYRVTEGGGTSYGTISFAFTSAPSIFSASIISCDSSSILLTSSSDTANQWFLNGNIIPGAISTTYLADTFGYLYGAGTWPPNVRQSLTHNNNYWFAGDTSKFGNNVWNVYAFNAGDANGGSGAWVSIIRVIM